MIKQWDFSNFPCEKDKSRYKLKFHGDEDDVKKLIQYFANNAGKPFVPLSKEYNWAFYIYNVDDKRKKEIEEYLQSLCPKKTVEIKTGIPHVKTESPEIKIEVEKEEIKEESKKEEATLIPPLSQLSIIKNIQPYWYVDLNMNYTFEEFVVGANNRFTHAAALAVAENSGKVYNPLFIYGGVGLGKTHLMHSIGHHVRNKNPDAKILYVTTERFTSEVIEAIRKGMLEEFRERYRFLNLLLVDDIQFLSESESTQEEFFHIFNILHQSGNQIVITSDKPPKRLLVLEERIKSRFEWGLIADIKSPSLETRVAILKKKGEKEKVILDDNILLYVASRLKSNVRELEGFLKKINAYAELTGIDINMDFVKLIMKELLPEEEEIKIEEVKEKEEVPKKEIKEKKLREEIKREEPKEEIKKEEIKVASETYREEETKKEEELKKEEIKEEVKEEIKPPTIQFEPIISAISPKPLEEKEKTKIVLTSKLIEIGYFYPEGKEAEFKKMKENFLEIVKKHKLKIELSSVFERSYSFTSKINYSFFVELCKTNKIDAGVVLGPPKSGVITENEFTSMITGSFESAGMILELVPFSEINKQYKYLNLVLDITLTKQKETLK